MGRNRSCISELGISNVVAGELDGLFVPASSAQGRPIVCLLHGFAASNPLEWFDTTNQNASVILARKIVANAQVAAVGSEFAQYKWGAGPDLTAIRSVLTTPPAYVASSGASFTKMIVVGVSMGALVGLTLTAQFPNLVDGYVGIIPCVEPEDARTRNVGSGGLIKASINNAWGMPVGSTMATNPLPAAARPLLNVAAIASSGARFRFYGSTADTVVPFSFAQTLADDLVAAGADARATVISSVLDHSDAAVGLAPADEIARFIKFAGDAAA